LLQKTEDKWVQMETFEDENIKQVFWVKEDELKK